MINHPGSTPPPLQLPASPLSAFPPVLRVRLTKRKEGTREEGIGDYTSAASDMNEGIGSPTSRQTTLTTSLVPALSKLRLFVVMAREHCARGKSRQALPPKASWPRT